MSAVAADRISITRGTDAAFVDSLLWHLRELITCDEHRKLPAARQLMADPETLVLEVAIDGHRCGAFLIAKLGESRVVHTLLRSPARGADAIRAGRQAIEWIWRNTSWPALHSYCLRSRRDVMLFARGCGFSVHHVADCVVSTHGQRDDVLILKLERPASCQPQFH